MSENLSTEDKQEARPSFDTLAVLPSHSFTQVLASALYLVVFLDSEGAVSLAQTYRGVDIVQSQLDDRRAKFYLLYVQRPAALGESK